jgi:hypothetical protein
MRQYVCINTCLKHARTHIQTHFREFSCPIVTHLHMHTQLKTYTHLRGRSGWLSPLGGLWNVILRSHASKVPFAGSVNTRGCMVRREVSNSPSYFHIWSRHCACKCCYVTLCILLLAKAMPRTSHASVCVCVCVLTWACIFCACTQTHGSKAYTVFFCSNVCVCDINVYENNIAKYCIRVYSIFAMRESVTCMRMWHKCVWE